MENKGLEEFGKSLMNVANLTLVLFLFNTYMQKNEFNYFFVLFSLYGISSLYYVGYTLINKAQK